MKMARLFLSYSVEKLRQLEGRIQYCLERLSEDEVWWRGAEECSSVANLVLHLCGDVRQWILASIGGQPDQRHRDAVCASRGDTSISELRGLLKKTVDPAVNAIEHLRSSRHIEATHVQGYDKPVLEAIYHVVEHLSL